MQRRQFSAHTVASYTLDLHLFFAEVAVPLAQVSFREVDQFVEHQHQHGRAWATINRRLNALKHFFDFCLEQQCVGGNPVKPSHFVRRGRPLPKALSREQVQRLFAQIDHPMDRALFLEAGIIGVNNRDLTTFEVSVETSVTLAPRLKRTIAVSESGLRSAEDLRRLGRLGYHAFLIGEQVVTAADPGEALRELLNVSRLEILAQPQAGAATWTAVVRKADGEKCERCWHWETDVGPNTEHPTLCGRCVTAVKECLSKA